MKLHVFLPTLGTLAVFAGASIAASAQASSPGPAVHADLAIPATSSSSSSSAEDALTAPAVPAAAAAASAAAPAAPEADQGGPFSGLGVGFKFGLAGVGFDVATPVVPTRLNLRGGATFFTYTLNDTTNDNLTLNGSLKLQDSGVMLDFFPWRGSFRLSGGATVYNNKGVWGSLSVPAGNSFTLGNTKYYAQSGGVTGSAAFKLGGNAGGRISFGFGNLVPKKGHHFSFDTELGIEFVSAPTVALAFTGNTCTGTATCSTPGPVAASDVTAEENKLQGDVNFLHFYPIASVGFGWRIF